MRLPLSLSFLISNLYGWLEVPQRFKQQDFLEACLSSFHIAACQHLLQPALSNMTLNDTDAISTVGVGWQAGPDTRGTMSILSSCFSVILLTTWTCCHPCVGVSKPNRALITLTSILFPELPALMALKDFFCALRLRSTLRKIPGWNKHWTLKEAFLVVKGGFIARPAGIRTVRDMDPKQQINYIIDFEILIRLASAGCVRYKDFPTTKEINDKSKADWFAKGITLLQLAWFTTNFCYRVSHGYEVANLEAMTMEWVICGVPALMLWWQCPQNIAVAYQIPVTKFADVGKEREPSRAPQSESAQLQRLLKKGYYPRDISSISFVEYYCHPMLKGFAIALLLGALAFYTGEISHSHGLRWPSKEVQSLSSACVSISLLCFEIISVQYFVLEIWSSRHCFYGKYVELLVLDSPVFLNQEIQSTDRWLNVAEKIGIYDVIDMRQWRCIPRLPERVLFTRVFVVVVFTALIARFTELIIAIAAFGIAPSGLYDVPKTWALEAIIHVGG